MLLNPTVEQFLALHGAATLIVAAIGWAIRAANAKKSPQDAVVGWFVYVAAVAGFSWGGLAEYLFVTRNVYWGGLAGFGLIVGIGVGRILGVLAWHTRSGRDE